MHDESIFHTNEQWQRVWVTDDQQPLRLKGNGRPIHISDFICEPTGRLALTDAQLVAHALLPKSQQLRTTDARKIIYPGKNHDKWWDMPQLLEQLKDAVDIFEYMFPDHTAVFGFDCSAAHESFGETALNVNSMNVNPGGKTAKQMHDTIIPLNNPPPKPGEPDTQGTVQQMSYPADHADPSLRGKPKGMRVVLQERGPVWDELVEASKKRGERAVIGVCSICKLSQEKKDLLAKIAAAERAGQEAEVEAEYDAAESLPTEPNSNLCCMQRVLSRQQDFLDEKPMIQVYLEKRGHVCIFLPKFHCELNPIEMYWGFGKYRYRIASDGKFPTARTIVPQCLDSCSTPVIRRFFRKTWRYMDAYRKGMDVRQAAFAVKVYKSHRHVGTLATVLEALREDDERKRR